MHLLYFVQYFPPEKASGLSLVTDMLEGFAHRGWKVDVYIPTPTRGVTKKIRKEYAKKRKEILCDGNLIIHRMHLYREGKKMFQRTLRYSVFSFQCLVRGVFISADAIFTGGGPPTQGLIGGLIHKITKKKFIYNPQDLFPDSLIVSGQANEQSKVVRIGRKIERFAYKNADSIITISEDMARVIRSKTSDESKIHVVRNWIDTKTIAHVEKENNTLYDEFGLERNKFHVVYAGNLGMMQSVETIIYAAETLREDNDIQFVIFGNGSQEDEIRSLINMKRLDNCVLFPLQDPSRISEVYSLGDVAIIPCKKGTGLVGMPSKTWTIMATGTPIIGSFDLDSELDKTVHAAECGLCVEAENPNELANAISKLKKMPDTLVVMGKNARRYVCENAEKEHAVQKYIEIIEKKVNEL